MNETGGGKNSQSHNAAALQTKSSPFGPPGAAAWGAPQTSRAGSLGHHGGEHFDPPPTAGGAGGRAGAGTANKSGGSFARWRSATDDSWKKAGTYPAYINEFSFTRLLDMASPVLFECCARKESFPFVTFIKRKSALARGQTEHESLAYLRIDLASVLITSIRWSDGDIIEESCQMKCQKMWITYWQQNVDSTLMPLAPVKWESPVIPPSSGSS
ncbi:MAG: type VI secretion system tube protein Hcp [Rhodospirillales bacterium]